jgi:WD40 repeat protein
MVAEIYARGSRWVGAFVVLAMGAPLIRADDATLARKAREVLQANCYRCHGQEGAVEGGMNYILDRDKLVARKKVIPGDAAGSPLYKRVAAGKMPPPSEKVRPSEADVAVLKQWITEGAANANSTSPRTFLTETDTNAAILADLESMEKRPRRFMRYFTVAHLLNQGLGDDELTTYRVALSKLLNSLSWHPRITQPKPIDAAKTLFRIDVRDFMWDATLWNRVLADYPYAVQPDSATARAVAVATATRAPVIRADWFIATASRPPLYQDLLQLPNNASELERQLRVDVALNIQQERVARAGFNGSGISRNNRMLERHDSVHGAYWRSYDFNEVPQNLTDRDTLLPDRRNLFAYPLGPGFTDNTFQHAGGEIIFNLPNSLQGYMLVNAKNERVDKAPTAIVSDPKRPDRAVETGISCMSCHLPGIHIKADQIRAHVAKNPKNFPKATRELVNALYPPEEKMKALMEEDSKRYLKALEKTGVHLGTFEPVMTMTLRYEADVDLATAASEAGMNPDDFLKALNRSESLASNLGALKINGGTVQRQVFVQAFADVIRALRLGTPLLPGAVGQNLPDNTGEIDPLEGPASTANAVAFSSDGKLALFASADKSIRLWDVDAGRELKRFIGHSASVWSVAFSPDNTRALSGSADGTVRVWDVDNARELKRFDGHEGLVTAVAFSPDGKKALSGAYDHQVILWDLEKGQELIRFPGQLKYVSSVLFAPDGKLAAIAAQKTVVLWDLESAKELGRLEGHADSITALTFSADGRRLLSASDDGTARLWDVAARKEVGAFKGHTGYVKCAALSPDGKRLLTGGSDQTVRLWDTESGKETRRLEQHADTVLGVAFNAEGKESLSASRDSAVRIWKLPKPSAP